MGKRKKLDNSSNISTSNIISGKRTRKRTKRYSFSEIDEFLERDEKEKEDFLKKLNSIPQTDSESEEEEIVVRKKKRKRKNSSDSDYSEVSDEDDEITFKKSKKQKKKKKKKKKKKTNKKEESSDDDILEIPDEEQEIKQTREAQNIETIKGVSTKVIEEEKVYDPEMDLKVVLGDKYEEVKSPQKNIEEDKKEDLIEWGTESQEFDTPKRELKEKVIDDEVVLMSPKPMIEKKEDTIEEKSFEEKPLEEKPISSHIKEEKTNMQITGKKRKRKDQEIEELIGEKTKKKRTTSKKEKKKRQCLCDIVI